MQANDNPRQQKAGLSKMFLDNPAIFSSLKTRGFPPLLHSKFGFTKDYITKIISDTLIKHNKTVKRKLWNDCFLFTASRKAVNQQILYLAAVRICEGL